MRTGCITSDHFTFQPMEYIEEGDAQKGAFSFYQYCEKCSEDAQGEIEMQVTLIDKNKNSSGTYTYTFLCK